jgi:hypothetical protein
MHRISLSLLLLALACNGEEGKDTTSPDADTDTDSDTDSDTDTDTDTDTDCVATITSVTPENEATLVPLDAVVEITFDAAVPANQVTVTTSVDGLVEVAANGMSATFTPDDPWPADSSVSVEIAACGDTESTTFDTLPPPVDVANVEGNTYAVSWDDVIITEPGNGPALKGLLPVDEILLHVTSVDGAGAAESIATLAVYDNDGVTLLPDCVLAVRETADFSLNPYYQFSGTLQIVINSSTGQAADVEDFELVGRVSADGSTIDNVNITGLVDTADFIPGADCNSFTMQVLLQPTCAPCTIAPTGQCMILDLGAPSAAVVPGYDLAATCPAP